MDRDENRASYGRRIFPVSFVSKIDRISPDSFTSFCDRTAAAAATDFSDTNTTNVGDSWLVSVIIFINIVTAIGERMAAEVTTTERLRSD